MRGSQTLSTGERNLPHQGNQPVCTSAKFYSTHPGAGSHNQNLCHWDDYCSHKIERQLSERNNQTFGLLTIQSPLLKNWADYPNGHRWILKQWTRTLGQGLFQNAVQRWRDFQKLLCQPKEFVMEGMKGIDGKAFKIREDFFQCWRNIMNLWIFMYLFRVSFRNICAQIVPSWASAVVLNQGQFWSPGDI